MRNISANTCGLALPAGAAGHAVTHYSLTAATLTYYPPIEDATSCEVCVIGAGLAGLSVALELARLGKSVVLLEANRIAWSASGRNGGFVSPGFAESIVTIEERLGLHHAQELFRLSADGLTRIRRLIRESDTPQRIENGRGWLSLIRHADVASLERKCERMAHDYHYPQEFLSRAELRSHITSACYQAGLVDMNAFHIHPLEYASHLSKLACKAGARLFENSPVVSVSRKNADWLVSTGQANISARDVVVATNAHDGPSRKVNSAVLPVSTYVVAASSQKLSSAIRFSGCIGDTRRSSDYYRIIGPQTAPMLLWGGRITTRLSQPARLADTMKRDILSVYPQLDDMEIHNAWSGTMGYAVHKMPLIAKLDHGLWVATAFGGHGLNTTAMAGQVISAAICNGDDRYRLFEPFGPRYAGGFAGRIVAQFEYWRLRIVDRIEEARAVSIE